ncbi:MAG: NUDIX domain-containing protein [Chloroflexi bacterium]|nr:NUDIX domain-containing protein [Chloroflexota bacterium]
MPAQIKLSAALSVRNQDDPSQVLLVRRPDGDAEFPGMWGLPAASCRAGESTQDAARRIGIQKLGGAVRLGRRLATGTQERDTYVIQMSLYEAWLEDTAPTLPDSHEGPENVTLYTAWRWADPSDLTESADHGSLCSRLLLASLPLT